MRLRDLSIRQKLVGMQVLTAALVLACFGGFVVLNDQRVYRGLLVHHLRSVAQFVGADCAPGVEARSRTRVTETLKHLETERRISNAQVYDANGNLFATYVRPGHPVMEALVPPADKHDFRGKCLTLSDKVMRNGRLVCTLVICEDLTDFLAMARRNIIAALAVFIFVLAVGAFLAMVLQRAISKPINDLIKKARDVAQKDGPVVYPEKEGQDEIGDLSREFHGMLRQVKARQSELDRVNESLRIEMERGRALLNIYERAPRLNDEELYDFVLDQAIGLTGSTIGFLHLVSDDRKTV